MRTILRKTYFSLGMVVLLIWMASCSLTRPLSEPITRHLKEDELLLRSYPSIKSKGNLPSEELEEAVITEPNTTVGITRLSLRVHNMGISVDNRRRDRFLEKNPSQPYPGSKLAAWLKYKAGQPPVLIDTNLLNRDVRNLRQVCMARGYFQPNITYEIDTLKGLYQKQAKVNFLVQAGIPYKINKYELVYLDTTVDPGLLNSQYMRKDLGVFRIAPGLQYDHNLFEYERWRGTQHARIGGFYSFSPSLIRFVVDTNLAINRRVDSLPNRNNVNKWVDLQIEITQTPSQYKIQEIEFRVLESEPLTGESRTDTLAFNPSLLSQEEWEELGIKAKNRDTISNINFLVSRSLLNRVDLPFLAERVTFNVGEIYDVRKDQRARRLLRQLGMFQYLLVKYIDLGDGKLKMQVDAKIVPQYQLRFGLESFTRTSFNDNSFLPSIGINTGIRNRNAFRKSELFELSLFGSVGLLTAQNQNEENILQYKLGTEARVQFNQFLFSQPVELFLSEKYTQNLARYSPTTILSASFDYTRRGSVNQIIPGFQLTYQWQHIPSQYNKAVSRLTPLAITYVDPNSNDATTGTANNIIGALAGSPLKLYDFRKRLNSRLHYTYTQQNYRSTRAKPTYWYQLGLEYGGNLPLLIENIGNQLNWGGDSGTANSIIEFERKDNNGNQIVDTLHIGLYARMFGEGKIFIPLGNKSEIIFRGRISGGSPFGRSRVIPKEYRTSGGGVNGLRGWQANTLGPGTISREELGVDVDSLGNFYSFVAPGGDYSFEVNAEYRFQPFQYVEFALFSDVGNVWLNRRSAEALIPAEFVEQALLKRGNFQVGWDLGVGLRLDFDYVIIRLDLAHRLFDPGEIDRETGESGWIIQPSGNTLWKGGFSPIPSLGINYPF